VKTLSRTEHFDAPPEMIFPVLDDLGVTGTHMTTSSAMMMGSKLKLEYLTPHRTGLNSSYRWRGKMMGVTMDFTVKVVTWEWAKEKVWETIGTPRLIIYSWYKMTLRLDRREHGTDAVLSISYRRPFGVLSRLLCFFLADWYCRWCLRKMLGDAKQIIERQRASEL